MILPTRSHRYLLFISFVVMLSLLVGLGPALAQAEPRLEISVIDTSEFPNVRVAVIATDGESQRRPGVDGLVLHENDAPVGAYDVAELPVGIELIVVIDDNPDIESHDEPGGLSRREKVRDSILRFAEEYMDATQLDRVTIIVPEAGAPAVLLDSAIRIFPRIRAWIFSAVTSHVVSPPNSADPITDSMAT